MQQIGKVLNRNNRLRYVFIVLDVRALFEISRMNAESKPCIQGKTTSGEQSVNPTCTIGSCMQAQLRNERVQLEL